MARDSFQYLDLDDSHLNFRSASVFLAWEERLASAPCHACPSSIINETIAAGNWPVFSHATDETAPGNLDAKARHVRDANRA